MNRCILRLQTNQFKKPNYFFFEQPRFCFQICSETVRQYFSGFQTYDEGSLMGISDQLVRQGVPKFFNARKLWSQLSFLLMNLEAVRSTWPTCVLVWLAPLPLLLVSTECIAIWHVYNMLNENFKTSKWHLMVETKIQSFLSYCTQTEPELLSCNESSMITFGKSNQFTTAS